MAPSSTPINKTSSIRDFGEKLDQILNLLNETRAQQEDLKKNIPAMITEQLQRHENRRKLVVCGFPEDATRDQVSKLFSLVGIPSEAVTVLHHLGKPRTDGKFRPLCVEIAKTTKFPHLKTLAQLIRTNSAYSSYSVRRLETPEQRLQGFLARKARREAAPEVTQSTPEQQQAAPELRLPLRPDPALVLPGTPKSLGFLASSPIPQGSTVQDVQNMISAELKNQNCTSCFCSQIRHKNYHKERLVFLRSYLVPK